MPTRNRTQSMDSSITWTFIQLQSHPTNRHSEGFPVKVWVGWVTIYHLWQIT